MTDRSGFPFRPLIAGALIVILASACSDDLPETVEAESISELYNESGDQLDLLEAEYYDRVTECMAREGFDYVHPPERADIDDVSVHRTGVLTGSFDSDATRYGWTTYLVNFIVGTQSIEAPPPALSPLEADAYERALFGSPDQGGCLETAQDAVAGFDRLFVVSSRIDAVREEIAVRLDAEPQALEWIDCMAGTGLLPEVLSTEAPFHALADEVGLVLLPSTGLAGIDDHEHGDVIESAQFIERENRYVLDEEALNDALAKVYDLESELFRADKQCAESSGLADSAVRIREDVEATVLAELGSE